MSPSVSTVTAASLADNSFRWDGTTSDLAQQLYRRFQKGDSLAKRSYSSIPSTIQTRLDAVNTTFDALPGILQRALVWDSGYVEKGTYVEDSPDPRALVRVQTVNGVSMAEIAVSQSDYEGVANCPTRNCTQPDGVTWFKNYDCTGTAMLKAVHCLVDSFGSGKDPHLAMWSTGGVETAIPAIRLLKHQWNVTTTSGITSYTVAAIHTVEGSVEPDYDQCSVVGSTVIACESPETIGSTMKAKMQSPKPGALVTAWLEEVAAIVPTPSPTQPEKQGTSLVVVIVSAVVAVLIAAAIVFWCCRRRARSRAQADEVQSQSVDHYHRPMATPHQQEPFFLGSSSAKKGTRHSVGPGTRSTGSTATRPTSFDETKEDAYQAILRTLLSDPSVAEKQIEYDEIEFAEQVSKGAYGEVWVGYWNREIVALKRLLRSKHQTPHDIRAFAQEIQLSARLHHPNVVRFVGVSWNGPEDLCMLMEILPAGDLAKVLRENGDQLTWNQHKLGMVRGLSSAVAYLHSQSPAIIHRDLKSKNVLLTNTLEPKVIDFGVSRRKMDDTMTAGVGTPYWTAPEVLEGLRYTEKSDIYSLGVLLTELDTCQIPYFDVKNELGGMIHLKILNDVVSGKLRPSVTETCPSVIREIIECCVRQDPASRPTAAEVLWMLA